MSILGCVTAPTAWQIPLCSLTLKPTNCFDSFRLLKRHALPQLMALLHGGTCNVRSPPQISQFKVNQSLKLNKTTKKSLCRRTRRRTLDHNQQGRSAQKKRGWWAMKKQPRNAHNQQSLHLRLKNRYFVNLWQRSVSLITHTFENVVYFMLTSFCERQVNLMLNS